MKSTIALMMKIGIYSALSAPDALAVPGGTYILKGNETSVQAIIQADVEEYPELYERESLSDYLDAFKVANSIGQRKLEPGDELVFPETSESRRVKGVKAAEEAAGQEKKLQARHRGIVQYQQSFLPAWMLRSGARTFPGLESGIPPTLIRRAAYLVDADFAESMQLKAYPSKNLYVIVFDKPARSSQCYFSAFKEVDDSCVYFSLEKGLSLFGAGNESVLWMTGIDGERVRLGARSYTELADFVRELADVN